MVILFLCISSILFAAPCRVLCLNKKIFVKVLPIVTLHVLYRDPVNTSNTCLDGQVVKASDYRARGPGLKPHIRKTFYLIL